MLSSSSFAANHATSADEHTQSVNLQSSQIDDHPQSMNRPPMPLSKQGAKVYAAGTFPNADSAEKQADCAAQGLRNLTPYVVVIVAAEGDDATICGERNELK